MWVHRFTYGTHAIPQAGIRVAPSGMCKADTVTRFIFKHENFTDASR